MATDTVLNLDKNIPLGWVILNMDFSENYTCVSQNEIQSAHWGHEQVTLHPSVAYYRCPKDDCEMTVQEALIFVSNDLTHDAHDVNKFVTVANDHLKSRVAHIEKEVQFTDGCSAQYKSHLPFCDLSYAVEDQGFIIERHFYGSRHGKGPSDGAGAVVKSSARKSVYSGNVVINTAEDMYSYGTNHLTHDGDHLHSKRTFFFINSGEINRNRERNTKTLKGTRSLHSIKSVCPLEVQTRNLSCFCHACVLEDDQQCENKQYVKEWKDVKLKPAGVAKARIQQPRAVEQAGEQVQQPQAVEQPPEPLQQHQAVDQAPEPVQQPQAVEQGWEQVQQPQAVDQAPEPVKQPQAVDQVSEPVQQPQAVEQATKPVQQPQAVEQATKPVQQPQAVDQATKPVQQPQAVKQATKPVQQPQAVEQATKPDQQLQAVEQAMKPDQQPQAVDQATKPVQQPQAVEQATKPDQQLQAVEQAMKPDKQPQAVDQATKPVQQPQAVEQATKPDQQPQAVESKPFQQPQFVDFAPDLKSDSEDLLPALDDETITALLDLLDPSHDQHNSYKEGDFVFVKLPIAFSSRSKKFKEFVAEVKKVMDQEVVLEYMEEVENNLYKWGEP